MYPTSDAYKSAVVQHARSWALDLQVTLDSGELLSFDESGVNLGTTRFKESATCTDNIQVGSVFANSLDFSIVNSSNLYTEYNFSNAVVEAKVGLLVGSEYEWVPLGVFNVATCGKKLSTIPLNCLDNMYKLNRSASSIDLGLPCNVYAFVQNICTACGVAMAPALSMELQALNTQIGGFDVGDYTCRDLIGFVGVLLRKNMRFNRRGLLEAFWYVDQEQQTTPETRLAGASFEDYVVQVTGVAVIDNLNQKYFVGSDEYVLEVPLNPLVQSSEQAEALAVQLLETLQLIAYTPYTTAYAGNPAWQAGDVLTHIREGRTTVVSLLMTHSLNFRGNSTLSASGKTPEQTRQLTSAAKQVQGIKTQVQQDMNQGLLSMEQIILNQTSLLTNALGFYPRVERGADGSISAVYLMSTPEDSDTTVVWAFTANGIGVSHTGTAGPYTSSWTNDDTIVAQVVTASMIKAGILQSRDGGKTFYLDLDNGILRMDATDISISSKSVSETLGEIQTNAGGLAEQVSGLESSTADRLSSLESSLALKADATSVDIQITKALQEGATKVDTTTGIRLDVDGVTVDKTGASTATNINENGMLVRRKTGDTTEDVLTANDQGVDAINLTARQYLVIGTRSRFENYKEDRTGCFWIG